MAKNRPPTGAQPTVRSVERLGQDAVEANLAGLARTPADPLILAVFLNGRPLHGLTGRVDWRIGGRLSELVARGQVPTNAPLLLPAFELVPAGRVILWRAGAVTPVEMARHVARMDGLPGLCPADFSFDPAEVESAFGGRVILYGVGS